MGAAIVTTGLLLATRIHATTPYAQIVVSMVLIGGGMGISFVSLTSASLAEVEPGDAGAASGLVNVSQQLGGALGLAVLVTVFDAVTRHVSLGAQHVVGAAPTVQANAILVHGLDDVFLLGALLSLAAFAMVWLGVHPVRQPAAEVLTADVESDETEFWLEREAG
jgi:MFS family permease